MDIETLRAAFLCDASAGLLHWKERPVSHFSSEAYARRWNTKCAGKPALTATASGGYKMGRLFDRPVKAHRVIWALHYGAWPEFDIDHIDGNPANNSISNLRLATHAENMKNVRMHKDNQSGHKGVSYSSDTREKWTARIMVNGVVHRLGRFKTPEEAAAAYAQASQRLHGQFSNSC
jgi:hypothetical protein